MVVVAVAGVVVEVVIVVSRVDVVTTRHRARARTVATADPRRLGHHCAIRYGLVGLLGYHRLLLLELQTLLGLWDDVQVLQLLLLLLKLMLLQLGLVLVSQDELQLLLLLLLQL